MQANYSRNEPAPEPALYQVPRIYDAAFSYRDVPAEVHVLTEWFFEITKAPSINSVLELAAGPASHAVEYLRRGVPAMALDLCPHMLEYAANKAQKQGLHLPTVNADMMSFRLRDRFDLALLLTDSACHIYSAKEMVRHLRTVAEHLNPGGLYVIEVEKLSHRHLINNWSAKLDGVEVEMQWGSPNDPYDRKRLLTTTSVHLKGTIDGQPFLISESIKTRSWSQYTLEKAVTASGVFSVARRRGDYLFGSSINDKGCWRLIYILEKKS